MASAHAPPAEPARTSPPLQKNIGSMPQGAASARVQQPPAVQQNAAASSRTSWDAVADRLTGLAVADDGVVAPPPNPTSSGGNSAADIAAATVRALAAARGAEAAARDVKTTANRGAKATAREPAVAARTPEDIARAAAAREKARAEAAAVRKQKKAEKARAKRQAAAAAAEALASRLAFVNPNQAGLPTAIGHAVQL